MPSLLSALSTTASSLCMCSSRSEGSIRTPNTPSPISCTNFSPVSNNQCPLPSFFEFHVWVSEFPDGWSPCAAHTLWWALAGNYHTIVLTSFLFTCFCRGTRSHGWSASALRSSTLSFGQPCQRNFPPTLSQITSSSHLPMISNGFWIFLFMFSVFPIILLIATSSHIFSPPPISPSFYSQCYSLDHRKPSIRLPYRYMVFYLTFWTIWTSSRFKFVCPFSYSISKCSRVLLAQNCFLLWADLWPFSVRSSSAR